MAKCYFVSDLHLFANRSKADKYLDAMLYAASAADYFVLGGDIFDFCWARTRSHSHTVAKAVAWVRALLESSPGCEFHYVLGNHDYHHQFVAELMELDRTLPNFHVHRYYVRLGSNLFMHGDVADREDHNAQTLAAAARNGSMPRVAGRFSAGSTTWWCWRDCTNRCRIWCFPNARSPGGF